MSAEPVKTPQKDRDERHERFTQAKKSKASPSKSKKTKSSTDENLDMSQLPLKSTLSENPMRADTIDALNSADHHVFGDSRQNPEVILYESDDDSDFAEPSPWFEGIVPSSRDPEFTILGSGVSLVNGTLRYSRNTKLVGHIQLMRTTVMERIPNSTDTVFLRRVKQTFGKGPDAHFGVTADLDRFLIAFGFHNLVKYKFDSYAPFLDSQLLVQFEQAAHYIKSQIGTELWDVLKETLNKSQISAFIPLLCRAKDLEATPQDGLSWVKHLAPPQRTPTQSLREYKTTFLKHMKAHLPPHYVKIVLSGFSALAIFLSGHETNYPKQLALVSVDVLSDRVHFDDFASLVDEIGRRCPDIVSPRSVVPRGKSNGGHNGFKDGSNDLSYEKGRSKGNWKNGKKKKGSVNDSREPKPE